MDVTIAVSPFCSIVKYQTLALLDVGEVAKLIIRLDGGVYAFPDQCLGLGSIADDKGPAQGQSQGIKVGLGFQFFCYESILHHVVHDAVHVNVLEGCVSIMIQEGGSQLTKGVTRRALKRTR